MQQYTRLWPGNDLSQIVFDEHVGCRMFFFMCEVGTVVRFLFLPSGRGIIFIYYTVRSMWLL